MGIFSVGARLVSKAIPKALKPAAKKAYRVANTLPEMLLGTGTEAFGNGVKAAGKGSKFMTKMKSGFKAVEADIAAKKAAGKGGFFKRTFKELINTPKDLFKGGVAGKAAAKAAGKSGIWGAIKGVGKATAKKMPLLGVAITAVIDGPEVFNAFKEGGAKEGFKELGGVATELGCMAGGAAIGSAICPGIGTIIGGIVGGIAGCFVRGKTYSERKEEAQQQQLYNDLKALGLSDEEIEYCIENGYTVDDVKKALEQPEQPTQPEVPEQPVQPTPVAPTQPEVPEQPVQPAPVAPVQPVQPTEPSQPVAPVAPAEPDQPVEPAKPDQPAAPVAPVAPVAPADPAAPVEPVAPADPTNPATAPIQLTNEQLILLISLLLQKVMEHDENIIIEEEYDNPFDEANMAKEPKIKYAA